MWAKEINHKTGILKTYNSNMIKWITHRICVLISVLYLIAPLQTSLLQVFHKVSHKFSLHGHHHEHDTLHTHDFKSSTTNDHHEVEHGHSHEVLTLFKKLFNSNKDNTDQQQKIQELRLDKHLIKRLSWTPVCLSEDLTNHNLGYIPNKYQQNCNVPTPPPKYLG